MFCHFIQRLLAPLGLAGCLAGCNLLMEANFTAQGLQEKTSSSQQPSPTPPIPSRLTGLLSNDTQSLLVDVPSGKIYVGTRTSGLGVYSSNEDRWTTYTTAQGLAHNFVNSITVSGDRVLVGTASGLAISNNGGSTWETPQLTGRTIGRMAQQGSTLFAATCCLGGSLGVLDGPSFSTDGGTNWTNMTAAAYVQGVGATDDAVFAAAGPNGLYRLLSGVGATWAVVLNADVSGVFGSQGTIYVVGYNSGLRVSNNNGNTWVHKTTADGLADDITSAVSVSDGKIYVATVAGLSISSDGGTNWSTKTQADGLGNNEVRDVYAVGSTIYAITANGLSISTNSGTNWINITSP